MLSSALVLSLDSLLAGVAIGAILARQRARAGLALLFGVGDALAGWTAWRLATLWPHWLSPLAPIGFALYGVYLLAAGAAAMRRPGLVWLLPMLFSLDNLLCPMSPQEALVCGAVSGALAWAGLAIGAAVGPRAGAWRERGAGAAALAAAASMLAF
jgi:putative Mn2+ efflux pump MntP